LLAVLPRQLAASIQPAAVLTTPSDGQQIFRFDTFGDEQLRTDVLQMNQGCRNQRRSNHSIGDRQKVDADVLRPGILGTIDLTAPATTVALLSGATMDVSQRRDKGLRLTRLPQHTSQLGKAGAVPVLWA
jgi:hypothetical protein